MGDCPVCLETLDNLSIILPCGDGKHCICFRCFIHLQKRECPLCRTDFRKYLPNLDEETRKNLITVLQNYELYLSSAI